MKKIISLCLVCFSLFFFNACKKDSGGDNGSNYYMKANVDGTAKNYTSNPMAVLINTGSAYSLSLSAYAGTSSLEGLVLQINQNNAPIAAGTYDEFSGGSTYAIAGIYNPGTSDVSAIFGSGLNYSTSHPLQIVITSMSGTQVSGTFSGELYDNSGTGTDSLLVSNGEFNLPIQ